MNNDKNDVITNIEICKWLQDGIIKSELYPVDGIKALAELISARANISHSDSLDNV